MALPLKNGADLYNFEMLRARLQNIAAQPTGADIGLGQIYFNTGSNTAASLRIGYCYETGAVPKFHHLATLVDIEDLSDRIDNIDPTSSSDFTDLRNKVNEMYTALNEDTEGVIDTWNEVVDFVNEYSGSENLSTILAQINARIDAISGGGTSTVSFTQTLTTGTKIGAITIDGTKTDIFAPTAPTLASLMDSSAIGGTSSYIYWSGSAWKAQSLGTLAFSSTAYAGGTAVTLNGTSKAANTASFYAPTSAGTKDYVLKSNGSSAPSWVIQSALSVGSAAKLATERSLWGQGFDGTEDISGALTDVTSLGHSSSVTNITLNSSGYVGIGAGATSPSYQLHVVGTMYASGATTLASTLSVSKTSTFTGKTTHNGGLASTTGTFSSTLIVSGATTLNDDTTVNGDLYVSGNIIADGQVSSGGIAEEAASGGSGLEKVVATIAVGKTDITIPHNIGTTDISVSVYENSGNYQQVLTDVYIVDEDKVRIMFGRATDVVHKVVIIG